MAMLKPVIVSILALCSSAACACPDGQSEGWPGICYPNVGGSVGQAWEKGKKELSNFEADARELMKSGVCGGDLCDALEAIKEYGKAEIVDTFASIEKAGERLSEGKPLDAIWHFSIDPLRNSEENAADAVKRSSLLRATGQVAASVYGGAGGAAAYTAWLTYRTTGRVGDAIKAGIISGATSVALSEINSIDLSGAEGVAARSALTGAVNGAAVALAGGSQDDIKEAATLGVAAVLIREGYAKMTGFELDDQRLRSSTGDAYCLKMPVSAEYAGGTVTSGCFAPPSTYIKNDNGKWVFDPKKFDQLDPNRPHVGVFATDKISTFGAAENSRLMVGVSKLPGWNAMAVGHDVFASSIEIDALKALNAVPSIATIPPALVITYMGSDQNIHEMIRDAAKRSAAKQVAGSGASPRVTPSVRMTEVTHIICGKLDETAGLSKPLSRRLELLIENAVAERLSGRAARRACQLGRRDGRSSMHEIASSVRDKNYCHRLAEKVVKDRQKRGHACYGSIGVRSSGDQVEVIQAKG